MPECPAEDQAPLKDCPWDVGSLVCTVVLPRELKCLQIILGNLVPCLPDDIRKNPVQVGDRAPWYRGCLATTSLGFDSQGLLDMEAHTYNPRTRKAETGRSRHQDQHWLFREFI